MTVPVEVVRSARARRLRLTVDSRDGRVRLTLPPRASLPHALRWVEAQREWIAAQQARLPGATPLVPGGSFPFRGRSVTIAWDAAASRAPALDGATLRVGGPRDGVGRRIERWLRAQALDLLSAETAAFAERLGVSVTRVSVGDPRGRWGSCASSGAIRYSWRLILAPDFVRQATVAHEVAHRVHMNHAPAFHRLVATLLEADPAPARAWLRRHGSALHWVGAQAHDPSE